MVEPYHPFRSELAKEQYLAHYNAWAERWPVPSETKFLGTAFGKTFVRISGPPSSGNDGLPLILLPGDSETSLAWVEILKAGLATNHRTYAVDHIYDNGKSVYCRPLTKPADYVKWLDEVVNAVLELEHQKTKVNLMGHSYGGWQVALYAAAHPDKVNKSVLLAPNGALRPRWQVLIRAPLYYFFPTKSIVRNYLYWYSPIAVQKDETRQIMDAMVEETVLSFQCFKRRHFVPPTLLTEDNCWNALSQHNVPTLYLVGEYEVTYSADKSIQHLAKVAPHVTTVKVADADHHLALVQPEIVNDAVQEFL